MEEAVCCPRFVPEPWDKKHFAWDKKLFVTAKVRTFAFMPLNFGSVMKRVMAQIEAAGAKVEDNLVLSNHVSKWTMELLIAVDKEVPSLEPVHLSGNYLSNVYEGPFSDTGKWMKDFDSFAKQEEFSYSKMYMWYTTCPKCAKKYGENYVVVIAS